MIPSPSFPIDMTLGWRLTSLPNDTGVIDLSRTGIPDCDAFFYLSESKREETGSLRRNGFDINRAVFRIIGRDQEGGAMEMYGNQTIALFRHAQTKEILSVVFFRVTSDPNEVKDWVQLLYSDPEAKLLGTISATALSMWTFLSDLMTFEQPRYWLTPQFGSVENWLANGAVPEETARIIR